MNGTVYMRINVGKYLAESVIRSVVIVVALVMMTGAKTSVTEA